jgi:hypothetical protein
MVGLAERYAELRKDGDYGEYCWVFLTCADTSPVNEALTGID